MVLSKIWVKASILNLAIVAFLGIIMRYKIAFDFPFLEQRNLLYAHSHFAILGWVTHTLYVLLFDYLSLNNVAIKNTRSYQILINSNLIVSYGLLLSFAFGGYNMLSTILNFASIIIAYLFTFLFFIDTKVVREELLSIRWFRAALLFNSISSIGTFYLMHMMVTKSFTPNNYLMSLYFYLNFQYNGWFIFSVIGLFLTLINGQKLARVSKVSYWLFFFSCPLSFFLSILWMKLPLWTYIFPLLAVIFQLIGAKGLFVEIFNNSFLKKIDIKRNLTASIILLSFLALGIKILLQTFSIHPEISKLAFGFRSIVIAYLHLVFLGIATIFLIAYLIIKGYINTNKKVLASTLLFVIGVILNELILMIQGVGAFQYYTIPYLNEALFGVSALMFFSVIFILKNLTKD
ncbi:MAG: hypothetical protein KBA06_03915 [Saprospiraceae bacterium]|nr:hypothetical protein [Saprospiraceae bacterium]